MKFKRNRLFYFFLVITTIALGLLSRSSFVPDIIYPYLGDLLYALMIYFIFGFLFPRMDSKIILLISISLCFSIEITQLFKTPFLQSIRLHKLGALILGRGFLWSDLMSYIFGGLIGIIIESKILFKNTFKKLM